MMRRNPPAGYVYVDVLAPLYRKPESWARGLAEDGALKTAKLWSYDVIRKEGDKATYKWWIMEWDEYLEMAERLRTKPDVYLVQATITFGPYDDTESASVSAMQYSEQLSELYGDGAQNIAVNVVKESDNG